MAKRLMVWTGGADGEGWLADPTALADDAAVRAEALRRGMHVEDEGAQRAGGWAADEDVGSFLGLVQELHGAFRAAATWEARAEAAGAAFAALSARIDFPQGAADPAALHLAVLLADVFLHGLWWPTRAAMRVVAAAHPAIRAHVRAPGPSEARGAGATVMQRMTEHVLAMAERPAADPPGREKLRASFEKGAATTGRS